MKIAAFIPRAAAVVSNFGTQPCIAEIYRHFVSAFTGISTTWGCSTTLMPPETAVGLQCFEFNEEVEIKKLPFSSRKLCSIAFYGLGHPAHPWPLGDCKTRHQQ
jgi:hypothetical protein